MLEDWAEAGLRKPSTVRLMRLDSFAEEALLAWIGALSQRDRHAVNSRWSEHMQLNL
jgi:mRNA interferase MazF